MYKKYNFVFGDSHWKQTQRYAQKYGDENKHVNYKLRKMYLTVLWSKYASGTTESRPQNPTVLEGTHFKVQFPKRI